MRRYRRADIPDRRVFECAVFDKLRSAGRRICLIVVHVINTHPHAFVGTGSVCNDLVRLGISAVVLKFIDLIPVSSGTGESPARLRDQILKYRFIDRIRRAGIAPPFHMDLCPARAIAYTIRLQDCRHFRLGVDMFRIHPSRLPGRAHRFHAEPPCPGSGRQSSGIFFYLSAAGCSFGLMYPPGLIAFPGQLCAICFAAVFDDYRLDDGIEQPLIR